MHQTFKDNHPLLDRTIRLSMGFPYLSSRDSKALSQQRDPEVIKTIKEQEEYLYTTILPKLETKDDNLLLQLIERTFISNQYIPPLKV